jgi:hypothetical protein
VPKTKSKKDVLNKIKKRKPSEFVVTTVQVDNVVYIARYTLPNGHVETINTKKGKINLEPMKEYIGEDFRLVEYESNLSKYCNLEGIYEVAKQLMMRFKEVV